MNAPLSRRAFLRSCGAGVASLALADALASRANADGEARPNILFILADDLGYECLGCNGGSSFRTPVLDELARTGMRFEYAYSNPLCSPSRVQCLSGQYNFRNYEGWGDLPEGPTFASALKSAGYATAVAGKWQLAEFDKDDNVPRAGFDEYCLWTWTYKGKMGPQYWDPSIWQNGKLLEGTKGKFGEDLYGGYLRDFIARKKDKPFLAYYTTNLIHSPIVQVPGAPNAGKAGKLPGMLEYLDKQVGALLETLEKNGLREKTLIVFTADNGCTHGVQSKLGERTVTGGKGKTTDAGTHVPFIANWKSTLKPGQVSRELVDLSDIFPTFLDVAGAPRPANHKLDGTSLAPLFRGQAFKGREWAYASLGGDYYLRDRRWKLHQDGRLYDMDADPEESKPCAASGEAADARKRLEAALKNLRADAGRKRKQ